MGKCFKELSINWQTSETWSTHATNFKTSAPQWTFDPTSLQHVLPPTLPTTLTPDPGHPDSLYATSRFTKLSLPAPINEISASSLHSHEGERCQASVISPLAMHSHCRISEIEKWASKALCIETTLPHTGPGWTAKTYREFHSSCERLCQT